MSRSTGDGSRRFAALSHLSDDEYYRLIAAERRREVVDVLSGRSEPIELSDLAAGIAARERGTEPEERFVEQVAVTLHHVHLPKLADAGVIGYDPSAGRIDRCPGRSTPAEE